MPVMPLSHESEKYTLLYVVVAEHWVADILRW